MRLIGVALRDQDARDVRRRRVIRLRHGDRLEALHQFVEAGIRAQRLEVADRQGDPARGRPLPPAKGDDALTRKGLGEVLCRPEDGATQWMIAEHGLIDQVLGNGRGLVVVARDLLNDHAALLVELHRVQPGTPDEVSQQISGLEAPGRACGDVEGDEVVAGVGIEHGAVALGGVVDVAVGRVFLAALEDEVLEEVRHAVLRGPLGAGSGVERDHDRDGLRALHRDPVQRQAIA